MINYITKETIVIQLEWTIMFLNILNNCIKNY